MRLLNFLRRNAVLDIAGFSEWALKTGKKTVADVWVLDDMPPQARLMVGLHILTDETLSRFIFALRDKLPIDRRETVERSVCRGLPLVLSRVLEDAYRKISIEAEARLSHLPSKRFGPTVNRVVKAEYAKELKRLAEIMFQVAPKLNEANAGKFAASNPRQPIERAWR